MKRMKIGWIHFEGGQKRPYMVSQFHCYATPHSFIISNGVSSLIANIKCLQIYVIAARIQLELELLAITRLIGKKLVKCPHNTT